VTKNPNKIIDDIRKLLGELEGILKGKAPSVKKATSDSNRTIPKGAIGAIQTLIEDKFFDKPKEISAIMEKLKEIGHYHSKSAVSMNLLNLTKRRIFNRIKNKETKNWEYVIRR
jgi:hypothetical protein